MSAQDKVPKYYLAHHIHSRHKIRKWELKIEKKLNIDLFNPFYDTPRSDIKLINMGLLEPYDYKKRSVSDIVEGDLNNLKQCDGLVAILSGFSIGVPIEIFYCKHILNKPVYVVLEADLKHYKGHPWIRYLADKIFTSRSSLTKYLKDIRRDKYGKASYKRESHQESS